MNPKSGTAGSPVPPAAPTAVVESDTADPGEIVTGRTSDSDSPKPPPPHKPDPEVTSWIEIELVDEEDQPVVGEKYAIELPSGRIASGSLDHKGFARVEGIAPGTCKITFPRLDKSSWGSA